MFGVVLWSNTKERTAVIWCEDHGDLAIYNEAEAICPCTSLLGEGDLVRVEMKEKNGLRQVRSAVIIEAGHAVGLPTAIKGAATEAAASRQSAYSTRNRVSDSTVVPFPGRPARRLAEAERDDLAQAGMMA